MFLEILDLIPNEIPLDKRSILDFEENQQKIINKLIELRKYKAIIRHAARVKSKSLYNRKFYNEQRISVNDSGFVVVYEIDDDVEISIPISWKEFKYFKKFKNI